MNRQLYPLTPPLFAVMINKNSFSRRSLVMKEIDMRIKLLKLTAAVIAVALLIGFGSVLMMYAHPMADVSLDLSLVSDEDLLDAPAAFDNKGWTVFTQDGDTKTELISNGFGGYSGLELGQTFYFSRVMEETLDSPTLQLGTVERQFSVWLDDVLIYTDCPELDNRIGHVQLPMSEWFREDPIIITLPTNYQGKTLTIAQSFPEWTETGSVTAWPASVRLYCGYAYESGLISESIGSVLVAALAFVIGAVLVAAFVRSLDWSILCLSLVAFSWMTEKLIAVSFFARYYGSNYGAIASIAPMVGAAALLVFLTLRAMPRGKFLWIGTGAYLVSVIAYGIIPTLHISINSTLFFLIDSFPEWVALGTIVVLLVMGLVGRNKNDWFFRIFTPTALGGISIAWLVAVFFTHRGHVFEQIQSGFAGGQISFIYHCFYPAVAAAAIAVAIADAIRLWLRQREETALLEQRQQLLLASFDNMRLQHEEVMKLRHDMISHYEAIRAMTADENTVAYLDTLIGQNKAVRPIIHTGNQTLDIILNSKLFAAIDAGIQVNVERACAPEKIDMADADLTSLVMNMMNNAITGAKNAGVDQPQITIDVHVKDHWLVIKCSNSADTSKHFVPKKEETVPKHGLGLKIMADIANRYRGVFSTEAGEADFKVTVSFSLYENA